MAIADHLREGLSDTPSSHRPAGIEVRQELEPAAGAPVSPPSLGTVSKGGPDVGLEVHPRRIDGEEREVVELDSVGSSANRVEEALLTEYRAGRYPLPVMSTTITAEAATFEITSLDAPHRSVDAWLRLSAEPGSDQSFETTANGRALSLAHPAAMDPVLEMSAHDLVFGVWDSHKTGPAGQLRVPRAFTSTVLGFDPLETRSRAARRDPMNIDEASNAKLPEDGKSKKLSEYGLSSVPPQQRRPGVSISAARFTGFLSFAALRRLRFERYDDTDARVLLAALCLYGVLLRAQDGWFLRSDCDLIPSDDLALTLVRSGAAAAEPLSLTLTDARALLDEAIATVGIQDRRIRLVGGPRLTALVERGLAEGA